MADHVVDSEERTGVIKEEVDGTTMTTPDNLGEADKVNEQEETSHDQVVSEEVMVEKVEVKPKEEKVDVKPKEEKVDVKPKEEKVDVKPKEEKVDVKPKEEKVDVKPKEEKVDVKPKEEKVDVKPKEEKVDVKPKEESKGAQADGVLALEGSTKDKVQPVRDAPAGDGSSWFGGGILDMVVNNTSQIAGMLQWGESEPPYSLSKDASDVQQVKERMVQKLGDKNAKGDDLATAEEEAGYKPVSTVADMTMYNRLGVECTATKSKIKQAYYKLALKYHPDKNPNDEEAKKKFQDIGEAYQILFDENLRKRYDQHGSKATVDFPMMDASIFFMLLFGCEALDDYIGTLKIAHLFQYATSEGGMLKNMNSQLEVEQNLREVTLAVKLAKRIDTEVKDGVISKELRREISQLCTGTFSDTLVESIGWVYENCGDYYVADATTFWGLGTTLANIQAAGRSLGNTWSMARSVVNVALVVKDIKTDQDQEETLNKLKYIVENILSLVLYDVENTVRSAATKCCKDSDVPAEQRLARAKGLVALGRCMRAAAQKFRSGQSATPDVGRKMYEAFVKATEKKEEQ